MNNWFFSHLGVSLVLVSFVTLLVLVLKLVSWTTTSLASFDDSEAILLSEISFTELISFSVSGNCSFSSSLVLLLSRSFEGPGIVITTGSSSSSVSSLSCERISLNWMQVSFCIWRITALIFSLSSLAVTYLKKIKIQLWNFLKD